MSQKQVRCETCSTNFPLPSATGTGNCDVCDGKGRAQRPFSNEYDQCWQCEGNGRCKTCGGTGYQIEYEDSPVDSSPVSEDFDSVTTPAYDGLIGHYTQSYAPPNAVDCAWPIFMFVAIAHVAVVFLIAWGGANWEWLQHMPETSVGWALYIGGIAITMTFAWCVGVIIVVALPVLFVLGLFGVNGFAEFRYLLLLIPYAALVFGFCYLIGEAIELSNKKKG